MKLVIILIAMYSILESFRQIANNEGISITKLEQEIGASKGVLSRAINNNSDIQSKWLMRLVENYPQYNFKWLLTGEGPMLKKEQEITVKSLAQSRKTSDSVIEVQEIPLYNVLAIAGLKELFDSNTPTEILETIKIPGLPRCDGAITITGDSMYPLLKSGDMILYAVTSPENIFFGEMYLLGVQLNEWEEFITVKYIQKSEIDGYVKLVSQNSHHSPKDIPLSSIRSIALVKASIRINTMM